MPIWFSNLLYWSVQVGLLVLAAGPLPRLLQIRQPRVLLVYWRALIAVSLLLPFLQPWHRAKIFISTVVPMNFTAVYVSQSSAPVTHWHYPSGQTVAQVIGFVILAGIALRFVMLALGLLKLRQFRKASSPVSPESENGALLKEMSAKLNVRSEFLLSVEVDSPVTFGFRSPVILLPERFPEVDPQFQSAIACHELLHVRRHDWAHHVGEEILDAALWFHPAISWLIGRVRLAREHVVDFEVVRITEARKPYLDALLEFTTCRALSAAIPAPPFLVERQLAERVALMLKEVRMSRTRLIASLTAIACCLALIATLAVWTFPLKAAPRFIQEPHQSGVAQGVSGGIDGRVSGGIVEGVPGGINGATVGGAIRGVPGGIKGGTVSGATGGIPAGVSSGVANGPEASELQQAAHSTAKCVVGDINLVGDLRDKEEAEARILKVAQPHPCNTSNFDWLDELAEVAVRGDLQNHGYFEAMVTANPAEQHFDPATGTMHVTVHVTAGDQFRTGEIFIVSDDPQHPLATPGDELRQQIHLQTGDIFNTDEIRQGVGRIIQLYRAGGYAHMTQKPEFFIDRANHTIVSTFHVHEGTKDGAPVVIPSDPMNILNYEPGPGIYRAGVNGVGIPTCKYCPRPIYSEEAKKAKLAGTVYLLVTVLTNGHAGEIKVIKGIGKGLDEQAIETVRNKWTFEPAEGPDGKPVATIVPIQITFQLY